MRFLTTSNHTRVWPTLKRFAAGAKIREQLGVLLFQLTMSSALEPFLALGTIAFTWQMGLTLGLLLAAVILFATEKLSVDVVTFLLLIVLVGSGILTSKEAFAGFSNEAVIALGAIFVISGALHSTGVLDLIGGRILRISGTSETKLLFLIMTITACVSAVMNNTTATAMFIPAVVALCRRAKISTSKLLMPLAFASIMGGTLTLIGTSTNIAVSGYLRDRKIMDISMFEITPAGIVIVVVGIAYMMLVGRHMLVDRKEGGQDPGYSIREYLSEILVLSGSPLVGQRSFETDLSLLDFRILKIIRKEEEFMPDSRLLIEEGDTLLVEGKVEDLLKVKRMEGIDMKADVQPGEASSLKSSTFRIAEVLVGMQSELCGRTLKEIDFRRKHGCAVLAIYRHGHSLLDKLGDTIIRVGDMLLLQGPDARVENLKGEPGLQILEDVKTSTYHPKRGMYSVAFFGLAILLSTIPCLPSDKGWEPVPLAVALLGAALLTVITGCVRVEKAYEFIDWRLIILIAGMTAFGTAMQNTNTADWLAEQIVNVAGANNPWMVMAGFFILTIILTQPMSNAAAALVVLPVALNAAAKMGASLHSFAIAIMLAASISFITPFEPSCVLVYAPGKYRFRDYVKVGFGLTAVLAIAMLILIPILWPLK